MGDKGIDDLFNQRKFVHAPTHSDHICIVVISGKFGGFNRPGKGCAKSIYLVGGNLFSVAGSTQDNSK